MALTLIYPALVDTGATESCIDSELAFMLNLPVVDRQKVAGSHGADTVDVHLHAGGQPHCALLAEFTMTYESRTGNVILSND